MCQHLGAEVGGAVAGAGILFRKEAGRAVTQAGARDRGGRLGRRPGTWQEENFKIEFVFFGINKPLEKEPEDFF